MHCLNKTDYLGIFCKEKLPTVLIYLFKMYLNINFARGKFILLVKSKQANTWPNKQKNEGRELVRSNAVSKANSKEWGRKKLKRKLE